MTTATLMANQAEFDKRIEEINLQKKQKWDEDIQLWLKANITYEKGKVYEVVANGIKRRGFKRFLITDWNATIWDKEILMFECGGYWLDENDTPKRGDWMTIHGASNKAVLKLSENQNFNEVPADVKNKKW